MWPSTHDDPFHPTGPTIGGPQLPHPPTHSPRPIFCVESDFGVEFGPISTAWGPISMVRHHLTFYPPPTTPFPPHWWYDPKSPRAPILQVRPVSAAHWYDGFMVRTAVAVPLPFPCVYCIYIQTQMSSSPCCHFSPPNCTYCIYPFRTIGISPTSSEDAYLIHISDRGRMAWFGSAVGLHWYILASTRILSNGMGAFGRSCALGYFEYCNAHNCL